MKKWYCAFLYVALAVALCFPATAATQKEKVLLDTDMVEMFDDGVALVMLANAPNIDLVGVTCVSGNSWVQEGIAYTLRQLEIEGKAVPVAVGMLYPLRPQRQELFGMERNCFGMGHDTWTGALGREIPESWEAFYRHYYGREPSLRPIERHAVNFIIDTVRANPNQITIAEIGPCGNLAAAVRMAPDIVPLIKRVVYMGGAFFRPGNVTPAAEFNWWFDPEAAQIVLRTPFREQIVFGLDVCEKIVFRRDQYQRLLATLGPSGQAPILRDSLIGKKFETNPNFTFFVWDVIVAAAIIDPTIVTAEQTRLVDVNTQFGPSYGQSLAYPKDGPVGTQPVRIVTDINQKRFWDMVNDKSYWASAR